MARSVSHNKLLNYFKQLQEQHTLLEAFFRFNWNEIKNAKINIPLGFSLLMESHAGDLSADQVKTFNRRTISLLVLKPIINPNDFTAIEAALDESEQICLDIISRIDRDAKAAKTDRNHPYRWLHGFDKNGVSYDVDPNAPLFSNMYGYNLVLEIENPEDVCYDAARWLDS